MCGCLTSLIVVKLMHVGVVKNTPPEEKLENEDKKEIFNDFYVSNNDDSIQCCIVI